ncbi:hypothetical protein BDK89_2439 [Ilumatobacter fluminis]|uniref:Lipoprotein antigen n=1 Tax=Ilumatobacter fluminis TaxID=467091 RepID=A0A4R7I0A0_9ACTN|nr:hypothetical protein [Ilumatobacter fluminis]TDT16841.1 hypothetical protein BDK89_2439 [Ilumatobacter fluminis]
MRRTGTALIAALLVFAGCGGDDTDSTDSDDAAADVSGDAGDDAESGDAESDSDSDADVADADGGDADGGDAPAAGNGTATVVIDGTTYQFAQVEPGPDDDYYTFCSTVAGTLQAVFPLVDDAGTVVEGGELSVIFLEPGGIAADQGESPEFSVSVDQQFWFHEEGQPIDVPADGRSASGTATLLQSGTMNAETGAIETTPFDVTIEMSC